jgi:predicted nucleotide-binding protein
VGLEKKYTGVVDRSSDGQTYRVSPRRKPRCSDTVVTNVSRSSLERSDLTEVGRQVLDSVVEFYISNGTPTPIDHVVLSSPVEATQEFKEAAVGLGRREILDLVGLAPRYQLIPTYLGLLLSSRAKDVERVADRFLSYFKNQLRVQGVKFQRFTLPELVAANVIRNENELPLAQAVLHGFDLYSDGSWSVTGTPTGSWAVPYDIVDFRAMDSVVQLQTRVALKRKRLSEATASGRPPAVESVNEEGMPKHSKDVFVVHGRNIAIRDAVFDFLRSVGLKPMEWEEARRLTGKASPYVGEILDAAFDRAQAVVVILSGDDEARLREVLRGVDEPEHETNLTPQSRANVLFEAGMAMGRDADRTVLVEFGRLRPFSDVAGRHTVRMMSGSAAERQTLVERLSTAGCDVEIVGRTDWLTRDYFEKVFRESGQGPRRATPTAPVASTTVTMEYAERSGLIARLQAEGWDPNWVFEDEVELKRLDGWDVVVTEVGGQSSALKARSGDSSPPFVLMRRRKGSAA